MNLHQPLPSSCYLNTGENASVSISNLKAVAPKSQKKKQRLRLGATKVDPALFQMIEKECEKKTLTTAVTAPPLSDNGKTYNKSVSTEEQCSGEECSLSEDELDQQKSFKLESRSDNRGTLGHNIPLPKQCINCAAKEEEEHNSNFPSFGHEYKNVNPIKPKLYPSSNNEAQKNFGSAKSISSENYFSEVEGSTECKSDLSRFTERTSISSDELFNRTPYEPTLQDVILSTVESISYEDLLFCLKNGMYKVAAKLGSTLNSLASSLPHDFGEY